MIGGLRLRDKIGVLAGTMILLISAMDFLVGYGDIETDLRSALRRKAEDVRGMLMATRRVYHQQFLASGLPVDDKTLGFLPAHALSRISRDFPNWSRSGLYFNNVSDRPRNPNNRADASEMAAIAWFRAHPKETSRLVEVREAGGNSYYHYTAPIWVEAYCLTCHGAPERAPASVAGRYREAYGYQIGDLRGVMSIKLPTGPPRAEAWAAWRHGFTYRFAGYVVLMLLLGVAMHRLVARRLARLEATAARLAAGDYAARAATGGAARLRDEIDALAAVMDGMAGAIEDKTRALAKSEERFRLASENMKDCFVLVEGEAGRVIWWNRAAEELFGFARQEVLGRPLVEFLVPEAHRPAMAGALVAFARHGQGAHIDHITEATALHRDGTEIDVEISLAATRGENGWQAIGVLRDIRERKAAREALRRSEERLNLAISAVDDGIWDWDLRAGTIYFSPKWKAMLGYADDELADRMDSFTGRLHPDDAEWVAEYLDSHLQGYDAQYRAEFRMRHKDGSWRWILGRGEAQRDAEGKAYRMLGSHTDISALKQAEDALRQAATVFTMSREGIMIVDAGGGILDVNESFTRITGYARHEAVGARPEMLRSGRHDVAFYAAMRREIEASGTWQGEIWNRHKSGSVYPARLHIAAVRNQHGELLRYIATYSLERAAA
jgi:PAS domain S-box-containing protein